MKLSKLTASLLTSTAVFAGVMFAQSKTVSANSLKVNYSSNLRQQPGTDAKIIGGLSVGETHTYTNTATKNGYTWFEIGDNQWVADAGAQSTGGQVKVNYASNKRVGPSTSHKIIGGYYPGQVLTFTATAKANGYTWYKVGANAWIASAGASEFAGAKTTTAAPAAVATTAASAAAPTAAATTATAAPSAAASNQAAPSAPAAKPAATTTNATASQAAPSTAASTPAAASTAKATTTAPAVTAASGRVKTSVVSNLRSNAGTGYGVVGSLPAGAVRSYSATAQANGYTWYKVGANAWVAGATPYYGTTNSTATPSQSTTSRSTASNTASSNTTSSYQAASGNKTSSDNAGNAYAWGQCTWYVKSVAPWAGNHWGNGGQWGASAAAEGFTVNHTPSVGSIVVVAGGQNFGGWTAAAGYGHVAYVVGVSGNTITVQQGGMGFGNPGGPNTQTVSGASSFTYIHR